MFIVDILEKNTNQNKNKKSSVITLLRDGWECLNKFHPYFEHMTSLLAFYHYVLKEKRYHVAKVYVYLTVLKDIYTQSMEDLLLS